MKKIVIVCGLIAGAIASVMIIIMTVVSRQTGNMVGSMWLGYATMLLAFSLIFIGIKNYRDNYNNGVISFGKAFKTGLFIALIGSTVYVLVWLVCYYVFIPDYLDKYSAHILSQIKANGASEAELKSKAAEMSNYKEMYKSPLGVILFTYAEILPVGILVTLICALLLKKKSANQLSMQVS